MTTAMRNTAPQDERGESIHPSQDRSPRSASPLASLAGYWTLPGELQRRIFFAACEVESDEGEDCLDTSCASNARPHFCKRAALSLSLAGRHFYILAMPLLLYKVRLTRPSALRSLQQLLSSRPALGRLVKRLHIGEQTFIHGEWYPLDWEYHSEGHWRMFRVKLDSEANPSGGEKVFRADGDGLSGVSEAMRQAIQAAARDVDIDLCYHGRSHSGDIIGEDAYYIRVFELQAALELYCLAIGGSEDEEEKQAGVDMQEEGTLRYPRLIVESGTGRSLTEEEVFVVTRPQLYRRMSRAGSDLDKFEHPLLCARSGLPWFAFGAEDVTHSGGSLEWRGGEGEDFGDVFALSASAPPRHPTSSPATVPADLCNALDPLFHTAPTIGSCLSLARSILSLTATLQTLSLTGFFERAVAGFRSPPALLALRHLSLGPPAPSWNVPLCLDHAALHSVEELRICSADLTAEELDSLAGIDGALPRLENLRWSTVGDLRPRDEAFNAANAVDRLLQVDRTAIAEAEAAQSNPSRKRRRVIEESSLRARPTLVEAILHPHNVDAILAAAPSDAVRAAWVEGTAVQGIRHRLKLQSHAHWMKENGSCQEYDTSLQAMYDDGKDWWNER